jgi:hypothetical protein
MKCYVLSGDPCGPEYQSLVEYCCSNASDMILVVRDPTTEGGPTLERKLAQLRPHVIAVSRTAEWPGTILYGDEADVFRYRVSSGLEQELKQMECLWDWIHPDAPEDPCFFRANGEVLLVTTSHERDAYLVLTAEEYEALQRTLPALASILGDQGETT